MKQLKGMQQENDQCRKGLEPVHGRYPRPDFKALAEEKVEILSGPSSPPMWFVLFDKRLRTSQVF